MYNTDGTRVMPTYGLIGVGRHEVTVEPQFLYKYGGMTHYTEETISLSKVWFSAPAQLNDPFECRPWFEFNHTDDQLVEGLARQLRRQDPNLTSHGATARAVAIFLKGRHRDPKTWEALRNDLVATLARDIGLFCLSQDDTSILMWAHYAKEHTGYCLGFEATNYTPFFGAAQRVGYSDNLSIVDSFNSLPEKIVNQIFLTKFSGWHYEKEWRIVDHDAGPGLRFYPPELLKSVTFGLRTPEVDRRKLREWVERRGHDVVFRECVMNDRQFKIQVYEVG